MIKKYIYLKKIHIPQLLEEGSKTKHSAEGYRKRDTTTPKAIKYIGIKLIKD